MSIGLCILPFVVAALFAGRVDPDPYFFLESEVLFLLPMDFTSSFKPLALIKASDYIRSRPSSGLERYSYLEVRI